MKVPDILSWLCLFIKKRLIDLLLYYKLCFRYVVFFKWNTLSPMFITAKCLIPVWRNELKAVGKKGSQPKNCQITQKEGKFTQK